jgi:AcrR family transcriptional regulator
MFATLDQGRFDISLKELCSGLGVTTGSFYSHYGDMPELHRDLAGIWLQDRVAALPEAPADGVDDPLESLRGVQAWAAESTVRDGTMRGWAAAVSTSDAGWVHSIPVVRDAVSELDQAVVDHLTRALTDLGFTGRQPADLARWLAAALQAPALTRDREGLETSLDIWVRAVAFSPEGPAVERATAAPDATRLYTTARRLPPGALQTLQQVAELVADAQNADDPPDHGRAGAGQA